MKKRTTNRLSGRNSERGIALILTLAILVMVTLLVVAFAISMRVENTASKNFNDLIKARQLAQAAVDQAVATIRDATPVITNAPALTTYVTAPGVTYTLTNGLWVTHSLSTLNPATIPNTGSVDLNQRGLITGVGNGEFPAATSQLWVGWSNIVVNANGAPQVVGRFAYWVDDESAKVNLNVAGSRGTDFDGYTPAAIELQNLHFSNIEETNITNYVTTVRPLDTIKSIEIPTGPNIAESTYSNNQFYVTVNSTSPDLTPWGDKRMNVSNLLAQAVTHADTQAVVAVIANLLQDARLNTWFGQTFATKYINVAQIAANIIDYIDTDGQPTDSSTAPLPPAPIDTIPPTYLGLEVTPYLNELVISNTITATPFDPVAGTSTLIFNTTASVELWYMYTNTIWNASIEPGLKVQLLYSGVSITVSTVPPATATPPTVSLLSPVIIPASGLLHFIAPGGYDGKVSQSITNPPPAVLLTTNTATIILNPGTVTAIYYDNAGRLDYAVIPLTNYAVAIDTTTGGVVNLSWITACNDPRVKPVSNNWFPQGGGLTPGIATLGGPNNGVTNPAVTTTVGVIPVLGDGDLSCHIVSGSRDRGSMYPGELSYIHTGVPWRTFWLQPQPAIEAGAIPDWAVLDLFSATDTTNVIGRLNINSAVTVLNDPTFPLRLLPITALLTNTFSIAGGGTLQNSYVQATAVDNVYDYPYTPASHTISPSGSGPFCPSAFTMVGEVANTQSLSDTQIGAPPTGTSKSNRETPVRGIANLITTRSGIFTIWCVAQTIKDVDKNGQYNPPVNPPPGVAAGNDFITGEVKVQAIVQRYEDPPGTVKFRTLYYRYIYN